MVRLSKRKRAWLVGTLLAIAACPFFYLMWWEDEILQFRVNAVPANATAEQLVTIFGNPSFKGTRWRGRNKIVIEYEWAYTRWDGRKVYVHIETDFQEGTGRSTPSVRACDQHRRDRLPIDRAYYP
jgi:hypothetical protein